MKKMLAPVVLLILTACNSAPTAPVEAAKPAADTVMPEINSPYPVGYSSKFSIGNPKNAETILALWKDFDNGNLLAHKDYFADSVELYIANGLIMQGKRDSILGMMQKYRDGLKSVLSRVDAVTSVKSRDKNEDWVLVWGVETDTYKNGKVDSVNLMETWRINSDGKANLLFQFNRATSPPKKMASH